MNLFDLVATLSLDTSQYEKGLEGASGTAGKFAQGFGKAMKVGVGVATGVATAVTGLSVAFTKSAKKTAEYGDNIDKMSQKLGLSAEAYQKWDYVIELSGANIDSMATGLKTLTNKLESARNGGEKSQKAFEKLGLSMDDLEGASREEVFEKTIKAFQGMEDSAERASLANQLFGRSGQELTPLFNQTAESTDELMEKAEKYGMVMSEDAVKASAEFQDSLTTLGNTATGLKNRLMGEFLPSLTKVTDGLALVFTGDMSGADQIVEGITETIEGIKQKLPEIMQLGGTIVKGLASALLESAPVLFSEGAKLITDLVSEFIKALPEVVSVGTDILTSVIDGITEAIPDLIEAVPEIITSLIIAITTNLPKIIESGGDLIVALVKGIIKAIPVLVKEAPTIIKSIVDGIISAIGAINEVGGEIITALGDGISGMWEWLKQKVTEFASKIPSYISDAITGLADIGLDIVEGIWNGISGGIGWIKQKISGWVGDVMGFIKGLFGISSPSKWARDVIGGNIVKGLMMGIENGEDAVQRSFNSLLPDYDGDYTTTVSPIGNTAGGVSIVNYITVDGAENPEDFTDRFVRRLRMDMRTV